MFKLHLLSHDLLGLVNQVKFLALAPCQWDLATFKTFCAKPAQSRYGYSSEDRNLSLLYNKGSGGSGT